MGAGGGSGGTTASSCATGELACSCYPNLTCNSGLMCLENFCLPDAASGGTSASSGGSSSNAGQGQGGARNGAGAANGGTQSIAGTTSGGSASAGSTGSGGSSAGTSSTVPGNLIMNGDFSDGTNLWEIKQSATTVVSEPVTNGMLCFALTSDQYFTVGWPAIGIMGADLPAGGYTLSFKASSSGALPLLEFTAKVGAAAPPYAADYTQSEMLGPDLQTYSLPFQTTGDSDAGVVFLVEASYATVSTDSAQFCLDDVTVTPSQ
jgi:hypothetical protein